jgi:methionine-rich copper-binding protein CopC
LEFSLTTPGRGLYRGTAVTLLCALALLLGAAPAAAHAQLVGSDPEDGAGLTTPPEEVSLTFNETVQPEFAALTVVGPDGAEWQTGDVTADGPTVTVAVRPLGPAGRYEIGYRVISADGHPVTGSVGFTLTAPGPGAAESTTAPPAGSTAGPEQTAPPAGPPEIEPTGDGGGVPVWPWVAGAVVLVGGGVAAALRLGRQ